MKTTTRTEYRIMARRPGKKRFSWVGSGTTLEVAQRRLRVAQRYATDWEYRIDERTVVEEVSPWRPVQ